LSKFDNFIWYEKYRPKQINEMVLPPNQKDRFTEFIDKQEIPHLLFYGPPGSGKTTLSFILMDSIKSHRLVLNASSEDRGIATVKGKVKQFAAADGFQGGLNIIFLDEADSLTVDAQRALRNTMETYSSNCRFILTGNYVDKILPEIKSRCISFEFNTYPKRRLIMKAEEILKAEKISFNPDDLHPLIDRFYPDIRSIINNLQVGCVDRRYEPSSLANLTIDFDVLNELILKGQVWKIRKMLVGITDFLWLYKYLFDRFINESNFTDEQKREVACSISEHIVNDARTPDKEIVFIGCLLDIMSRIGCQISFNA
jgi:replication factor C small subunit